MKMVEILSQDNRSIYGIDFSGAKDAGRKIWIARGTIEGKLLIIDECKRASELPGSGIERDLCLSALHEFHFLLNEKSF